jgi:nucleoside-diphosphate-sugar epimerase
MAADIGLQTNLYESLTSLEGIAGLRYDFVVNCGGTVDHRVFNNGGKEVIDQHLLGVINLLNILERHTIKRWVQFGSSDQYGSMAAPQKESARELPFSPYSFAKTAVDYLLQMLWRSEAFPATSLRLFLAYGPGQNTQRFIPQVIRACLEDKDFPTSEGRQVRDFCYIDDVIDAVENCLYCDAVNGEVMNLGSGYPARSIKSVIEDIQRIVAGGKPKFGEYPYRPGENMELVADMEKTLALLNWRPKTSFAEGISRCIEDIKRHRE